MDPTDNLLTVELEQRPKAEEEESRKDFGGKARGDFKRLVERLQEKARARAVLQLMTKSINTRRSRLLLLVWLQSQVLQPVGDEHHRYRIQQELQLDNLDQGGPAVKLRGEFAVT